MTHTDIDTICEGFIASDLTPEDYLTDYIHKNNFKLSFNDGKILLNLLHDLSYVDNRFFKQLERIKQSDTKDDDPDILI